MQDKIAAITNAVTTSGAGLEAFTESLSDPAIVKALTDALEQMIACKGRLIVAGMGKSGHIARKLAATFASTGTPAYFVHPAEASHGDLGMIQSDDVLLLLSWSGETKELSDILTYAIRFKVPVISLTGSASGTLARKSDIAIVLPQVSEACPHNLAPTSSTLLQLAVGDALAITLLQMRGFTEASFRDFHPGGKLGAILTPVSDVMHRGDALPLIRETASIIDVVGEISRKSKGVVGLTNASGELTGLITDGDIRRYLETNSDGSMRTAMQDTHANQIMTTSFIAIDPDRLCARALNVLQSNKISAAFVLDGKTPIGLITMLQLLQAGVA